MQAADTKLDLMRMRMILATLGDPGWRQCLDTCIQVEMCCLWLPLTLTNFNFENLWKWFSPDLSLLGTRGRHAKENMHGNILKDPITCHSDEKTGPLVFTIAGITVTTRAFHSAFISVGEAALARPHNNFFTASEPCLKLL
jgi:hypothetical protein